MDANRDHFSRDHPASASSYHERRVAERCANLIKGTQDPIVKEVELPYRNYGGKGASAREGGYRRCVTGRESDFRIAIKGRREGSNYGSYWRYPKAEI